MRLVSFAGATFDWVNGYVDADDVAEFTLVVFHGGTSLSAGDFIL
ncbi:hypothetical protein ACI6QG_13225 [Roseococcus sp. DSY-14]